MAARKPVVDRDYAVAVALLVAVFGAEVLPPEPCDVGGCRLYGSRYRNGVWCDRHAQMMEWRPGGPDQTDSKGQIESPDALTRHDATPQSTSAVPGGPPGELAS